MKTPIRLLALAACASVLSGCVAAIPVATSLLVGERAISRSNTVSPPRVTEIGPPPFERSEPVSAPDPQPAQLVEATAIEEAPGLGVTQPPATIVEPVDAEPADAAEPVALVEARIAKAAPGLAMASVPIAVAAAVPEPEPVKPAAAEPVVTEPTAIETVEIAPSSASIAGSTGKMGAVLRTGDVGPIGPADGSEMAYDAMFARVTRVAQRSPDSSEKRLSAMLRDPGRLEPTRVECGITQTALLIDLDPADGPAPLEDDIVAGERLKRILAAVRDQDVAVLWLSEHGIDRTTAVRGALTRSGLDPTGADPLYLARFANQTKASLRTDAAREYCVVAILGDQWQDFDPAFLDAALPASDAAALDILIDEAWFIGPAPLNPKG